MLLGIVKKVNYRVLMPQRLNINKMHLKGQREGGYEDEKDLLTIFKAFKACGYH